MNNQNQNNWRPFLWLLFIGVGFLIGVAWKSKDSPTPDTNQTNLQDTLATGQEVVSLDLRDDLNGSEKATIRLFEVAAPSVCFITTTNVRLDFWSRDVTEIPRGTGSGFIWDKKGHIVTNYHVIQGADRATVTLADRSTWEAKLVGSAPEKDLAVLKIEVAGKSLRPIPVGQSDNLLVGQSVFAIGNPFGLDQTLTTGIVSALGREIESVAGIPIRDVIQTDAAINPGNSGGPLLNSSGKLIGVNTAIYSPSGASAGIGFSIPVDVVSWAVPELIRYGEIKRPSLGVELAQDHISRRLGLQPGVLVINVVPGSSADKAGIMPTYRDRNGYIQLGDLIIGINDEKIKSNNDLVLALEAMEVGEIVKVKLLRKDKLWEADLKLEKAR